MPVTTPWDASVFPHLGGLALSIVAVAIQLRAGWTERLEAPRHRSVQLNIYCLLYTSGFLLSERSVRSLEPFPRWAAVVPILLLAFSLGTLVGTLRAAED